MCNLSASLIIAIVDVKINVFCNLRGSFEKKQAIW